MSWITYCNTPEAQVKAKKIEHSGQFIHISIASEIVRRNKVKWVSRVWVSDILWELTPQVEDHIIYKSNPTNSANEAERLANSALYQLNYFFI